VGVNFFNPTNIGGTPPIPKFQLFQNWDSAFSIPANTRIYFWFGGNRESANLTSPSNQFAYWNNALEFSIIKLYIYHSPIFNAEEIEFNLLEVSTATTTNLGVLNGVLPAQRSEIICSSNTLTTFSQYEMEIKNKQIGNVFTPYQITALCEKV
jgi:hypothetical protein